MPCFVLESPETEANITRPIVHQIAFNLLQYLEYPVEPNILYQGPSEQSRQPGSRLEDHETTPSTSFINRVFVRLDEHYPDQGVLTTPIKQKEHNPVFIDQALEVYLRPIYIHTLPTLEFECRFNSLTQASRFRDTIRRRMSEGMQARLHELQYHYQIPPVLIEILKEVHRKREAVAGYDESLEAWFHRCFSHRMSVISNRSGTQGQIVIAEKQIQVQGWLSFETQPDAPTLAEDGSTWVMEMSYTFEYDKPISVAMDFPIAIHNQLLDEQYTAYEHPYSPYEVDRNLSHSMRHNDAFSQINYYPSTAFQGARIPEFDDWTPKYTRKGLMPLLSTLICVELDDPYQLVNLMELGDYTLAQEILNFIYRERNHLGVYLDCVFHLTLYRGAYPLDEWAIEVTENLDVRSKRPLNPRESYHLRLSLVYQLELLSEHAKLALRRDPLVCMLVFEWLNHLHNRRLPLSSSLGAQTIKDRFDQYIRSKSRNRPDFDAEVRDFNPDGSDQDTHSERTNSEEEVLDYSRLKPKYNDGYGLTKPTPTNSGSQTLYPRPTPDSSSPYLSDRLVVVGGQLVTKTSFDEVARTLHPNQSVQSLSQRTGMLTVMQVGIITHRTQHPV